jgi:hypothetical protein
MSAIAPLMGVDQTSIRPVEIDGNDPNRSLARCWKSSLQKPPVKLAREATSL